MGARSRPREKKEASRGALRGNSRGPRGETTLRSHTQFLDTEATGEDRGSRARVWSVLTTGLVHAADVELSYRAPMFAGNGNPGLVTGVF
jgi:hypothetical protein